MQTFRFILAFAEMLLSPAILLYLLAGSKAMPIRDPRRTVRNYRAVHAA